MKTLVVWPKTMINFLNINTASAPIQKADAKVKYKIKRELVVHAYSFSVLSIPTTKTSSIKNMAIESWAWNLLASL